MTGRLAPRAALYARRGSQLGFAAFAPQRTEATGKMYDLLYWYIHVGNILLMAGILTGSVWAASSWGRYWGWDPKEVWSLVAFLAYMAILHAKVERMLGQFGVAAISILAFQTILMTYLGVNYVLGTGLHSYGFGDSPIVKWMIGIALVESVFVLGCWLKYRANGGHADGAGSTLLTPVASRRARPPPRPRSGPCGALPAAAGAS